MLLRTDAFVYSLLAALSDPSFCDRVFELLNGVKDTIASMEQDPDKVKLIDRYANRLCCILKSPLAWESHMKYGTFAMPILFGCSLMITGFESAQGDMSVVGRLHLRRVVRCIFAA